MTIYEGIRLTDGDRLYDMLDAGVVFRDCDFDDADFANIEADSLVMEGCSLRRASLATSCARSCGCATAMRRARC